MKSFNFKKFIAFIFTFFLMFGISYAEKVPKVTANTNAQITKETETPKLKKILLGLIKQNNHMDDVIDELKDSGNNLNLFQISSLDLTFNILNKNLKQLSILTKDELMEIQPASNTSIYAKTILSYATKLDQKVYYAQKLIKNSLSKNSLLRDVPRAMPVSSSGVYSRQTTNSKTTKKTKGKNLLQVIKEQKAIHKLSKNINHLKLSTKKLHATSKWLFIVTK